MICCHDLEKGDWGNNAGSHSRQSIMTQLQKQYLSSLSSKCNQNMQRGWQEGNGRRSLRQELICYKTVRRPAETQVVRRFEERESDSSPLQNWLYPWNVPSLQFVCPWHVLCILWAGGKTNLCLSSGSRVILPWTSSVNDSSVFFSWALTCRWGCYQQTSGVSVSFIQYCYPFCNCPPWHNLEVCVHRIHVRVSSNVQHIGQDIKDNDRPCPGGIGSWGASMVWGVSLWIVICSMWLPPW